MYVGSWKGHTFEVSPNRILGFRDFEMTSEAETEDETENEQTYVKWKSYKPKEISMTIVVNHALGVWVWTEVENWIKDIGYSDYLYIGPWRVFPERMMLTKAKASKIGIAQYGEHFDHAEVDITLKVAETGAWEFGTGSAYVAASDGGGGGDGGGGNGTTGPYTATVYYSGSSGAIQSVSATSNISYADALKKAKALVPGNALWSSEVYSEATNQDTSKDKAQNQKAIDIKNNVTDKIRQTNSTGASGTSTTIKFSKSGMTIE